MTVRSAYEAAGSVWGSGPSRVYGALAEPLLAAAGELRGKRALGVGTGAGVVARGLAERGARVVACDLAYSMLAQDAQRRPPAVVADVLALPFRAGSFEVVTVAFVLNHLAEPAAGLRELARASLPGALVLATAFEGEPTHPAKTVVDRVAARFGFTAPEWYAAFKRSALASRDGLAAAAVGAALSHVTVEAVSVRPSGMTAGDLVDWRLGMAHLAGFVAGLDAADRVNLREQAVSELAGVPPLELPMLLLRARC